MVVAFLNAIFEGKRGMGETGRKEEKKIKKEEQRFAYWFFKLRDPEEAAKKAGVEDGISLMRNREVRKELSRLKKEFREDTCDLMKLGLCRILFSQPECDENGEILKSGFSLEKYSEKTGEYKFWDKLKACELLLQMENLKQNQDENKFVQILEALQQSSINAQEDEAESKEGGSADHP